MLEWVLALLPIWVYAAIVAVIFVLTAPYWRPLWVMLPAWCRKAVAAAGAGLALYFAGRKAGVNDTRAKARDAARDAAAKAEAARNKVSAEVNRKSDTDVSRELEKWNRD